MRLLLLTSALLLTSCGDIARMKVDLRFPDEDTRQSTQQLLFLVREPPQSGEPCAALWGQPPSGLGEYVRLIDYPNAQDVLAAPLRPGLYSLFVYALPARLDVLCDGDEDCVASAIGPSCRQLAGGQRACLPASGVVEPIVGGCTGGSVSEASVNEIVVPLDVAP